MRTDSLSKKKIWHFSLIICFATLSTISKFSFCVSLLLLALRESAFLTISFILSFKTTSLLHTFWQAEFKNCCCKFIKGYMCRNLTLMIQGLMFQWEQYNNEEMHESFLLLYLMHCVHLLSIQWSTAPNEKHSL